MIHRILIVGFGNPFMGDDGVGTAVLRRLAALAPPSSVRLADGHTDGLTVGELWHGEEEVWLIDGQASDGVPGTVTETSHDGLSRRRQRHESAHGLSLPECIAWLRVADARFEKVRFRLFAVEVQVIGPTEKLSAPVEAAVEPLARRIAELWSGPDRMDSTARV